VSFSKFVYDNLTDRENGYFVGFYGGDTQRILTLAEGPNGSLSSCQIQSFSQWFRIDSKF